MLEAYHHIYADAYLYACVEVLMIGCGSELSISCLLAMLYKNVKIFSQC